MTDWLKKMFRGQIPTSLLYVVLGICLIAMPLKSVQIICMVFGGILVLLGIYHMAGYLRSKEQGSILELLSGVLQLGLGAFLLFNPRIVMEMLPIFFGAIILVDSIWTFQACMEMRRLHFVRWGWLMGVTVVFAVLGIVMIVNPFKAEKMMVIFVGIVYLLNGLMDIFFLLFLHNKEKILNKMQEAMVVEARYAERAGEFVDAQVNEEGKVVVEDVEVIRPDQTTVFQDFDQENPDIIDVEVVDENK